MIVRILAFLMLLFVGGNADAASRFWVAQPVSGAVVSVASPPQIRLTVSSTTGMTTGDVRTVFGVGGTTEANGTWTITVIDATHIDLQGTTFTNVYTSGGSVNGKWDATNTNNWVSTTGGSNYGQTVPGLSDDAFFDGSSGGNTITPNAVFTLNGLVTSAFTGTLDFSVNNNSITIGGWTDAATGVHTINMGNGTWTFTNTSGNVINFTNGANFTLTPNGSTFLFSATATGARSFVFGNRTINNASVVNPAWNSSNVIFTMSSGTISGTLTLTNVGLIQMTAGATLTVTGAITFNGNQTNQGIIFSNGAVATLSVASANVLSWIALVNITKAGAGSITVNNGFDSGGNTGITINGPRGAKIIGG